MICLLKRWRNYNHDGKEDEFLNDREKNWQEDKDMSWYLDFKFYIIYCCDEEIMDKKADEHLH